MPKKVWVSHIGRLLFIVSVIFNFHSLVTAEQSAFDLDFGKVRPFKKIVIERILPVQVIKEKADEIVIDYPPALKDSGGHSLPIGRLKMAINDQLFELKNFAPPINLTFIAQNPKLYHFMFSLELTPVDLPGNYKGTIFIRYRIGNNWGNISIQLNVEIQPWVRIETTQDYICLDQVGKDKVKLQNFNPFEVKVASNSSWILYLRNIKSPKNKIYIPLQVRINQQQSNNKIQLVSATEINIEKERKVLAVGNSTVFEASYWAEIELVFLLQEFSKYPSGNYDSQLQFTVELWDNQKL